MNNFLTLPKVCSSYCCPISGPSYNYFQPPSVSPFLPSDRKDHILKCSSEDIWAKSD